jgi:hypothetical protein
MGGIVMHINTHCCIHDSKFTDECSDNEAVEEKAMDIGGHSLEKVESFLTDIAPIKKSPRKQD